MPRLFIAVPISKTSKEIIVKNVLQNPVVKMPDIRWISENNLHITLKFLGEVPIRKVQLVKEIVQKSGLSHDSFKIQLKDSGVFPNKRTPRVLWIGIQPPMHFVGYRMILKSWLLIKASKKKTVCFNRI